jgi:sarcosine oxidase subunit alpha
VPGRRLVSGGAVDRAAPLRFSFDGQELAGLAGDTLASALLANGLTGGFRSPLLGRPRGVMTAGPEEPCAFVEVTAPWFDVLAPATTLRLVEGMAAMPRAGVGRLPPAGAPAAAPAVPSRPRHAHVETLVVGGGVAGLQAAREAAARGDRVLLVDERPWLGGTARSFEQVEGRPAWQWVEAVAAELRGAPDVTLLPDAAALGLYDAGYAVIHQRSRPVERLWHVRAKRVVLATGAHERPIAFAGNDRRGVMLAGAVLTYLDRFGVLPGEQAVVFTSNDAGYATARALRDAGASLVAVVDARHAAPLQEQARAAGLEVLAGSVVAATMADGAGHLAGVVALGPDGRRTLLEAELLAVSGGWNPVVQLHRAIGGGLRYDPERACFVPDGGPAWLTVVGAAAGEVPPATPVWHVAAGDGDARARSTSLAEHFIDLQRDQTVADVAAALDRGLRSVEHVKRATHIGTAADQGRTSGTLAAEIVNQLLGADPGAQGPTGARPPWVPLPYHVLAGPFRGRLFDPVRETPIHPWHVAHGAVFENVGQWKRPWYYPREGESMAQAVLRECRAAREGVAMMDASTLGKIEVVGPDAATFLDRMYSNAMSTLPVGKLRYGVMLGLDGMVFDDGVAMRLAEDRYLVTTTTGNAAAVLDRFEEWLQTEWPELRCWATSVTEQWATIAVVGPLAREVLRAAGTDVDVSRAAFPFMTWREGTVAGVPARIARVSFSGSLAFEVNVAAWHGLRVWEALHEAGQPFGLTVYGTETMHVLRAEKAFPIVGQDTDGTVTADDLGMSWVVNLRKGDFVGRRSLRRADLVRPDRKQLVGLLPLDPEALLPEGAQLIDPESVGATPPVPMRGHVTSSYRSATLGRTFALALLQSGRRRHGDTVYAFDARLAEPIPATVTDPVFYDPQGAWRDGDPTAPDSGSAPVPGDRRTSSPPDSSHQEESSQTAIHRLLAPIGAVAAPFLAQVDLRVDPQAEELVRLPLTLPLQPNTWRVSGDWEILWLGPDEWLVTGPPGSAQEIVTRLEAALEAAPHSVVDVSANRLAIDLTSPDRRDLLAVGCALDLHPRVWREGACAQTLLAHVPVLLQERAGTTRLFVRPSYAAWLSDWLSAAAG